MSLLLFALCAESAVSRAGIMAISRFSRPVLPSHASKITLMAPDAAGVSGAEDGSMPMEWDSEDWQRVGVGEGLEEEVLVTPEPPLSEAWSPLLGHLGAARWRKRALRVLKHPLLLIPIAVVSWSGLPLLDSSWSTLVRLKPNLVDTFAGLEDVVIGALGITLGVLVGTVVSVLRDRQEKLREALFSELAVAEVCAQQHVKLFRRDKPRLRRSMALLTAYLEEKRDLLEALNTADVRFASYDVRVWKAHWERQQRRTLAMLDVLAEMGDGLMAGPRYGFALFNSLGALEKCEHSIMELNEKRAGWRASLESKSPPSLFLTVLLLMGATVFCFVLRADAGGSGALLAETPVRALFTLMTSSFGALLQIMLDLSDPFAPGSFGIQLGPVRAHGHAHAHTVTRTRTHAHAHTRARAHPLHTRTPVAHAHTHVHVHTHTCTRTRTPAQHSHTLVRMPDAHRDVALALMCRHAGWRQCGQPTRECRTEAVSSAAPHRIVPHRTGPAWPPHRHCIGTALALHWHCMGAAQAQALHRHTAPLCAACPPCAVRQPRLSTPPPLTNTQRQHGGAL